MDFKININDIRIAGSENDVSKTIEELLELNKKIPARTKKEVMDITEKQLDSSANKNKKSRGEVLEVTEGQFGDRKEPEFDIVEVRLDTVKTKDEATGRRPESWDKDDQKIRGHKNCVPLWIEVYEKEDDRKNDGDLTNRLKK